MTKHHSSRKLSDHLTETQEVEMYGDKYQVATAEVHSDPIEDPGTGKGVILRQFEYSFNPELPKDIKITKQAIFDSHKKQIQVMLWGDGMIPLDGIHPPKVQISKSQKKYRIFVLCQPVQTLLETPNKI